MKTVVVLGGYGNFGKRIVENLAKTAGITILIAGRNNDKAIALAKHLQPKVAAILAPLVIDIFADDFKARLTSLAPFLVIHTSGPFQGQDYRVPNACIECGSHYIDLADDRRFVCDINQLDSKAKEKGVLIVSGASSVPGLSSAVVDHYQNQFSTIESINLAIAPGNKAERGVATVAAILSYTGHPLSVFKGGHWQDVYGWMDSRVNDFGSFVGKRCLANVDVPDLELFPNRYNVSQQVSFQAGLELGILHWTMVGMAYLSKIGIVKSWAPLAKAIVSTSNLFLPFGTQDGAMEVLISGQDHSNKTKQIKWTLYAPKGNGPYIPTLSSIVLAKKLLSNEAFIAKQGVGAIPCAGLFELDDFSHYFDTLGITYQQEMSLDNQVQHI
ncbi:saccharopine dehydrogenase [Pseudoalteromonas sp. NEC-BIFX-2020_015]|uniref:saccharopine dehydrogenase NADP-binding domain-containing protein n=1 Tax=Pseudoalteromonas sp. NEC-BIFX-2020_015 TaxID=2729544 RepID=UPI001461301D|nr:saccharopine dehydrogenase NADP-binding domain-containing protein [Pseudoalteromonas sp. NEC-BIFX-2020_015]NMR25776.1 saccharopine dehydrogenase [Pseudoalteromonas sp. NEC-BIFX-2020_015]